MQEQSAQPALPPLADNVLQLIRRAGDLHGQLDRKAWSWRLLVDCYEAQMSESPIEHLFWIAIKTLCLCDFNTAPDPVDGPGQGLYVSPQYRIGPYRVDFLVSYVPELWGTAPPPSVVVELDGHAFHDKDKDQRAYEKGRDRYLVGAGYRVLHYTGSEVHADPFRVAHEVLVLLGVREEDYDPGDPLGLGC